MGRKSLEERFWEKVDRRGPDEHWLWKGAVSSNGYGTICIGSRKAGGKRAHRVAFELTYGFILPSLCVCHTCDIPLCCNPGHLFVGTRGDNNRDMVRKGRQRHGPGTVHLPRWGEQNGNSKLTEAQVREIRARYERGSVTYRSLAAEYGVSQTLIGAVIRRELWACVE